MRLLVYSIDGIANNVFTLYIAGDAIASANFNISILFPLLFDTNKTHNATMGIRSWQVVILMMKIVGERIHENRMEQSKRLTEPGYVMILSIYLRSFFF